MFFKKKILIVIPARGGSKGIKLKNLRKIVNKSLLQIAIDFSKSLKFSDFITVSSDHPKIFKVVKKNDVYLTKRKKKLSRDHVSDFDILKDAISFVERNTGTRFDIIIYLQPTSPFRKVKDIKNAIQIMIKKNYDSVWSVTKISSKFHPKKIITLNNNGKMKLFLKSGEKIFARQQLSDVFIRNGIFYVFNKKKLLKEKTIYLKSTYAYTIKHQYVNIDSKEDLGNSKFLAKRKNYNF